MSHQLTRPTRFALADFARLAGAHPDLLTRLVALGLLEATTDNAGDLWFGPSQLGRVARIQRLRAGFTLNYAALGLVMDLLDRIAVLEAERRRFAGRGARTWT
jgi:hypothetical protein